ncbi:Elongator complex protein [Wickerhamomyces ciferrii]|uniref:Elongator complex protein 4 n=1 Tax=Wickerhamomyces ciferrii (strain ATCC 14091 / BCRC 22168 / CBS 111 / JCM 3599 / NBRC 0793 / NRRL Y-1031 F-60-10) TaxID=1206466 RepID=K0KUE2_WICCF|nr:Elongator complex protein [Wickerhamomyces ciferrii]CCH45054.1 Elongator complex protein [Wickerhamomyces ciferrii]
MDHKRIKLDGQSKMSFRKRGEVLGGPNPRIPNAVPGRGGAPVTAPGIPGRAPLGPNVPGRVPPPRDISGTPLPPRGAGINPLKRTGMEPDLLANQVQNLSVEEIVKHPGVRPSSITSQATISTGSADLDKILGHQGLPVGSSYLLEESGTTDFSSVLMKSFASQGIVQNRLDPKNPNTHVIVLSSNQAWGKELPGVYKGSSRDIKRNRVIQNEQKLSVQNLLDTGDAPKPRASSSSNSEKKDNDLRIAWRYGLNDPKKQQATPLDNETYKDFNHQFDITSRLVPSPNANEITYIPLGTSFKPVIKQLETTIQRHKTKIIRLVIPSFLNPSMYPPPLATSQEALQFVHSLRSLTRKYSKTLAIAMSIPLELYPRDSLLIKQIESLSDAVFNLEPFNQEMLKFLEKAYQNQPTKVQHGLVHVYKVPHLSEKGQMLIMKSEFAFKNGKKKFEIEEWGIPVEDEGEPQQTTQNIDF